jgi:hypothetical protein
MTNSRFTRETKFFASSRKSTEIIKRERKLKQKIDKDKKSLYVDSRSIRSRSENIFSNLEKLIADSTFENDFVVVSDFFVVFDFLFSRLRLSILLFSRLSFLISSILISSSMI